MRAMDSSCTDGLFWNPEWNRGNPLNGCGAGVSILAAQPGGGHFNYYSAGIKTQPKPEADQSGTPLTGKKGERA